MKGLRSSAFRGIYLYFWSNWLQAAENWHEFETALSIHIFFFFFFLYIVFFRGPRFIASANTAAVCKWDSRPPNRNHMARILLPDVSHVRTQEYTCYAGLILTQASFVLQSGAAQKNESEIYSTSATPLNLPVSLLSLRQPPFRATPWEYLHEQLPCRKSRPSPS